MSWSKIKKAVRVLYYWALCVLLNPNSRALNPYEGSPLKLRLTRKLIRNNKSAVRLLIKGEVVGVGFPGWIRRRARVNGLVCWARNWGRKAVVALLIGDGVDIERVARAAWKGSKRAKVLKVEEKWFNKPKKSGSQDKRASQVSWSQGTADRIINTLGQIESIKGEPNRYPVEAERLVGADELIRAADERNVFQIRCLNKDIFFVSPVKEIGIQRSQTTRVPTIVHTLTDHKQLAKDFLSRSGLPVPEGKVFTDLRSARKYLASVGKPLVVKPAVGLNGAGVTVDVRTKAALKTAWEYAQRYHDRIVVEELVQGVDIRVVIIGGVARAALFRVPANIVGDGVKTVEQLVDDKNRLRMTNPRLSKNLVIPNAYSDSYLERQGHSWSSVPEKNETVFLHLKANICEGADSVSVTDLIHPDLMRLAEEAADVFGIDDYWGIDLLVERIDLPRDQQNCAIIELNSTANIENVIYPLYGPAFDSARSLIDHMFPEETGDRFYPIDRARVEITGYFDLSFSKWVSELAKELNINGFIRPGDHICEVLASGSRHYLLTFLEQIWGWKENSCLVDGLQIYPADEAVKGGFVVKDERPVREMLQAGTRRTLAVTRADTNAYERPEVPQSNGCSLNTQLFLEEFKDRGYEAVHLYEELLEIGKGNKIGVTGMLHSSLFCDRVCSRIYPAKKLLALKGLPVLRGARFRCRQWEEALAYFKRLPRPVIVTNMHPRRYETYQVSDEKELEDVWKRAKKMGTNRMLIEEYFDSWSVFVAVAGGNAVGGIIAEPLGISGDGVSTMEQLIEEKNKERAFNPWYKENPVIIEDRFMEYLKQKAMAPDTILKKGKQILLESAVGLEYGGETASIGDLLHADFKEKAARAVAAIPGLELAVVQMLIPCPEKPAGGQRWAVYKIDSRPNMAPFHFPGKGTPLNLAGRVVSDLCLTDRAKWIKGADQ